MPDFSFSNRQQQLRAEIVEFAQAHLNVKRGAAESVDDFFYRRWLKSGEMGLPGLCAPEQYGGRGLNALDTTIALEALGYGCEDAGFNFAVSAHLLACLVPLVVHGNEGQKKEWLPAIAAGKHIMANAMTEVTAGSDVFNMQTSAEESSDGYQLSGRKTYCSNGPLADLVLTYALTNPDKGYFGGITAFLLEKKKQHFLASPRIEKAGLKSCALGEISFDQASVSSFNVLGEAGGGGQIFQQSMEWERICLGAVHLGEMERLLKKAVAFAKQRKSGGQSISKYQAVSHPWADLNGRMAAARQLMHLTAWQLDQGIKVSMAASMVKLMVSELYRDFAAQLHQLFAGEAFREDHFASRCLNDAAASILYSGTSEVQRNVIVRYLGFR